MSLDQISRVPFMGCLGLYVVSVPKAAIVRLGSGLKTGLSTDTTFPDSRAKLMKAGTFWLLATLEDSDVEKRIQFYVENLLFFCHVLHAYSPCKETNPQHSHSVNLIFKGHLWGCFVIISSCFRDCKVIQRDQPGEMYGFFSWLKQQQQTFSLKLFFCSVHLTICKWVHLNTKYDIS